MRNPDRDQQTVAPDGRPNDQQPKWRRDFPIDWPQDEYVSRRDLIKFITLTSFAFVAGQFGLLAERIFAGSDASPKDARAIARVDEIAIGGTKVFEYPPGSPPRLLVRLDAQRFVAYDQQCTHLLCPILPELRDGKLHCPCHNGWFDAATGDVLAGPPPRPLARIQLAIDAGVIYATGIDRRMT